MPRRQLGRHLRDLRNRSRLTARAASAALEWSEAKLWRIETGRTSLRSLDVEAMCRVYGAPADLTESLMVLARDTKARGWWHEFGAPLPGAFNIYIGLEEAAAQLCWYSSELVPGLLQTADYARTVIRTNASLSDEEVEQRVQVRVARRALFNRVTAVPTVRMALNEAVLRRPIGGHEVMAGQLDLLVEAANYPNVSIRVVPFDIGMNHGIATGPFVMLGFPSLPDGRETEPATVYTERLAGALFIDNPGEVDRYDGAFTAIWTSALDEARSMSFLHEAAREFKR